MPQVCHIFSQKALNARHLITAFFPRGEERKWQLLAEEEVRVEKYMATTAYGVSLTLVISFKYLGRVLSSVDDDWP